ncbi:hypothetical protein VTK56DRAFT_2886 [Thermocarpiscus australiensis]
MAQPSKTAKSKQARLLSPASPSPGSGSGSGLSTPPYPFKPAPESLRPFYSSLPKDHVYIAHIDPRPAAFKRKLFLVPVALNLAVALLFAWRAAHILPYYARLAESSLLGRPNETTLRAADMSYAALARAVVGRALTFLLDFTLAVFVWPWPYEFVVGSMSGKGRGVSPVAWRWRVGFRDKEIYVRRSRNWDRVLREDGGVDVLDEGRGREARDALLGRVRAATAPALLQQKTGYLTMDGDWDLDWAGMVAATKLVDEKVVALEAFGTVVLFHHERFGWLTIDLGQGETAEQEERRRQLFAFRDALSAMGKEDLFFRWVEMIQFEATQPGGFTPEKQVAAAQKVRDLFKSNGMDFDELWKEVTGTEGLVGMP